MWPISTAGARRNWPRWRAARRRRPTRAPFAAPEIDAVDICTASDSHAALTIAAARAGKHVHVEKPAALALADFDAMAAAIDAAGVSLLVGQTARFQPVNREFAAGIAEGLIGRPRMVHILWYTGHVWPDGWRGWQLDPARSGGHPVHNGVHAIDLAIWLLGAVPTRVSWPKTPSAPLVRGSHTGWRSSSCHA